MPSLVLVEQNATVGARRAHALHSALHEHLVIAGARGKGLRALLLGLDARLAQ